MGFKDLKDEGKHVLEVFCCAFSVFSPWFLDFSNNDTFSSSFDMIILQRLHVFFVLSAFYVVQQVELTRLQGSLGERQGTAFTGRQFITGQHRDTRQTCTNTHLVGNY